MPKHPSSNNSHGPKKGTTGGSKSTLKFAKPAENVESAREVKHRKRLAMKVPHVKEHQSQRVHKIL